jgi:hypothetical protein
MIKNKYLQYYAFPVVGYEVFKQNKIIETSRIPFHSSLLLKCNFYPNYLVVHNLPYQNYLVNEFMTDEMKIRNFVFREEIQKNKLMFQNLNIMWNFYIEAKKKILIEEKEQPSKRSVMSKDFLDVAIKFHKFKKKSKKNIMSTNYLTDRSEITVLENKIKYSIPIKSYIVNTMIDTSSNQMLINREEEKKYQIIGIYPIEH